jgi:hypothetical protein
LATKRVIVDTARIVPLDKPSKLVELHAKEFSIDLKVQRELDERRADKMADDFQPQALGLITASKRVDGHIYVLDGSHRVSAARKARYDGLIPTRLFEELTLEEEAQLFLTLNASRAVQAIDRFKVRVTKGEKKAVSINNVLKRYGLHVDWASGGSGLPSNTVISAIGAVERIYDGLDIREPGEYPELVDKVIRTLHKVYGSGTAQADRATYSRTVLEGMGILIATFGNRIDYERLEFALQGQTPRQIVAQTRAFRDAKVVKTRAVGLGCAMVLHRLYNARYRAKLPDFHEVEPKNASYHLENQDPLYVDPNQYVQSEVDEALEQEKQDA